MIRYIVYCHTSPTGKKYVGITSTDPQKRWRDGRGYEKNYHFYRAIKKYGWDNFTHEILHENLSEEEAKEIETKLIKEWDLTSRENGYNLREGGDGSFSKASREKMSASRMGNKNCVGRELSDSTREKISESLKKYYLDKRGPMAGKKHSAETIEKMKGRAISDQTKQKMKENHADVRGGKNPSHRKVVQMTLDLTIIKEYPYANAAAKELNLDLSGIIRVCRGRGRTCGGFVWRYAEEVSA